MMINAMFMMIHTMFIMITAMFIMIKGFAHHFMIISDVRDWEIILIYLF